MDSKFRRPVQVLINSPSAPILEEPIVKLAPESDQAKEVMTLRDVAAYLHIHYVTVYLMVKRGALPGFRLGGDWRVLRSEITKWIAAQEGRPPQSAAKKV